MSLSDERLLKLNERMERPLPFYNQNQIIRTRVINPEAVDAKPTSTFPAPVESILGKTDVRSINAQSRPQVTQGAEESVAGGRAEAGRVLRPSFGSSESGNSSDPRLQQKLTDPKNINPSLPMTSEPPLDGRPLERRPADDLLRRRDSLPDRALPDISKRVKDSNPYDSNSNFLLTNPGLEQKNKITDYFRSSLGADTAARKQFENLTSFSQASHLIKAEDKPPEAQPPSKWELIIKEKDKELGIYQRMLKSREDQLTDYKAKTREVVSRMVVELEEQKRAEKRRFINSEKWRVGEYITYRDGAHLKDTWENGFEIRELKAKLQEITDQKEEVEALKKKLKKKNTKLALTDEKPGISNIGTMERLPSFNQAGMMDGGPFGVGLSRGANINRELRLTGSIYKNACTNGEVSDSSNNYSSYTEKLVEENRERLHSRYLILTKEENHYREKIDAIERQKETYIKLAKSLLEEENCRFGRVGADPSSRWPLLKERYQLLALIGKGGFSEVYRAFDLEEMRPVACKIHQLSQTWSENFKSNYIKHALRENQVHKNLVHPNIVSHLDSVEIDSNSFCAVLEYCNGPDLASYLKKYKTIPEKDAKSIGKQILSGLKFLNETSKKIIHYDLKPQNILFHDGLIKISDFGLCKVMDEGQTRLDLTSQGVGTYWYLPPECFYNNSPQISTKVDVWSVGVILYELLYGVKPFGNDMCQEKILKEGVMLRAYTLDFPSKPSVSTELRELIRRFLEYNQKDRPDVIEAWSLLNKL